MRTHWRHLVNTIALVLPLAYPSPQPKRQIDRFSRFCTAHGKNPYTLQWDVTQSFVDDNAVCLFMLRTSGFVDDVML